MISEISIVSKALYTCGQEIKKIKKNIDNLENSYVVGSVHLKYFNKGKDEHPDGYILGDEYGNKHFKPIGGRLEDKELFKKISKIIDIRDGALKHTDKSKGEISFEINKIKAHGAMGKIKSLWQRPTAQKLLQFIHGHYEQNLDKLITELIREIKEEMNVQMNPHDFDKEQIDISIEYKKFTSIKNSRSRYHIYYLVPFTELGYKKFMKKVDSNRVTFIDGFPRSSKTATYSDLILPLLFCSKI